MDEVIQHLNNQLWQLDDEPTHTQLTNEPINDNTTYTFVREYKPNFPYEIVITDQQDSFKVTTPLTDDNFCYTTIIKHDYDTMIDYIDNVLTQLD